LQLAKSKVKSCPLEGVSLAFMIPPEIFPPGRLAEDFVAKQLTSFGWQLLSRNSRTPFAEVDIFALPPPCGSCLVLVEVKARHPLSWGQYGLSLGFKQRRRLARAMAFEIGRLNWKTDVRADLALVELDGGRPQKLELLHGIDLLQ
jgi:Holliday junction resolvase-like predicted endonuclease